MGKPSKPNLNSLCRQIRFLAASLCLFGLMTLIEHQSMASGEIALPPPITEKKASLRLTHLLFSATLDQYAKNGLTEYRPDFLLRERYLRTFLFEWGLALENGQATSTREIWTSISHRSSYLGANFRIWARLMPNIFKLNQDGIHIGHRREVFLSLVLNSEMTTDFNQRSSELLNAISRDLMTQDADQELGLKILEAFSIHGDPSIRSEALSLIQNFPTLSRTLKAIRWTRNIALGLIAAPGLLPSAAGVMLSGTKVMGLRLGSAIRLPELAQLWRTSSITRAGVISVGAHAAGAAALSIRNARANHKNNAAALAQMNEASIQEFRDAFQEANSNIRFLMTLSLNTASERSQRLLQQKDFALPKQDRRILSKDEWIRQGYETLRMWNEKGVLPKETPLWQMLVDGERLMGYWPKDEQLTRLTLESRYLSLRNRLSRLQINNIENFRQEVFANELEDYRGKRRTLTSMLLDWGGNCVSQTLMLISLLNDFPNLIPQGTGVGLYLSPTHMEAVLVGTNEIRFLVSGIVSKRQADITVLKPQALLRMLLASLDSELQFDSSEYYLNGRPNGNVDSGSKGLLESALNKFLDSESGLTKGSSSFKTAGSGSSKPFAPEHATVKYQEFEAAGEPFSADSLSRNLSPSIDNVEIQNGILKINKKMPNPVVPVGKRMAELCIEEMILGGSCDFKQAQALSSSTLNISGFPYLKDDKKWYSEAKLKIRIGSAQMDLDPDQRYGLSLLKKISPEMWIPQIARWNLEFYLKRLGIESISPAQVERSRTVELIPEDIALFPNTENRLRFLAPFRLFQFLAQPGSPEAASSHLLQNLRTMISFASIYESESQGLYRSRPEFSSFLKNAPLEKLKLWQQFNDHLIQKISTDPTGFIRTFAELDPKVKVALTKWGRHIVRGNDLSSIQPLRDLLDQLSTRQINLLEEIPEARKKDVPLKASIQLPVCHTERGCTSPYFYIPNRQQDKIQPKTLQQSSPATHKNLPLKASDIALLSLLSSGGLQLWDKKVFNTVNQKAPDWFQNGIAIDISSDATGMAAPKRVWPALNPNFVKSSHVRRPTEALKNIWLRWIESEIRDPSAAAMGAPTE